jgi:hypothetical protein
MDDKRDHVPGGDDAGDSVREGVVAADDTGMISNEIHIVEVEIDEGERSNEA